MSRLLVLLFVLGGLLPAATPASAQVLLPRRLIYVHVVTPEVLRTLEQRASQLDAVAPVYFRVEADGRVSGRDRPEVTTLARRLGLRVLPVVTNAPRQAEFSPLLATPTARAGIIEQLVTLVRQHGYDGLNIDFEDLAASDRAPLTAFQQELTARLRPLGKLSTIAVAAKPRELLTGWAAAYDYGALAQASDGLVLMTYAYHPASGPPGSTAPFDWVRRTVAFASSVAPPEKLLLGIGLWGYDWKVGRSEPAVVRTWAEIEAIAARPGAQRGYSATDESAWVRYRENGEERIIWFEDERAITAKLALIRSYRLAGWAAWRLGHEGPPAWNAFAAFAAGASRSGGAGVDWALPNGHFFTQAGEPGRAGFAVTDEDGVLFWSEFRRLGGVEVVGYPRSHRFVWNGFVCQVFQKAVFQWAPDRQAVNFVNVFDELSAAGKDSWLERERATPSPLPSSFDAGKTWEAIQTARLALLDQDPGLKQAYLQQRDPLRFFGLPTSRVEDRGDHLVVRLQRAVLQRWTVEVPWARAGQVTISNGGDIAIEAGLVPREALTPRPAS
jgi:spore germination protein